MKRLWHDSGEDLAGFPCATLGLVTGEHERALIGLWGEIWENGEGQWKAVRITSYGEKVVRISSLDDLKMEVELLAVPHNRKTQCRIGNARK